MQNEFPILKQKVKKFQQTIERLEVPELKEQIEKLMDCKADKKIIEDLITKVDKASSDALHIQTTLEK